MGRLRSSQAVHTGKMDPGIVPVVQDLKLHNQYPEISTSKSRFEKKEKRGHLQDKIDK